MKVSTIEIPKTAGKGSASSKKSPASGFVDILQDFEKKGGAAQLLAGMGLGMPISQQTMMQNQQNTQQNGTGTAQINNVLLIEELSQMSQNGIFITENPNNASGADGVFANMMQDTSAGMELLQQDGLRNSDLSAYGIQQPSDLSQVISDGLQKGDTAVPKSPISLTLSTKTGAESAVAQAAAAGTTTSVTAADTASNAVSSEFSRTVSAMASGTASGTAAAKNDATVAVTQAGNTQSASPSVQAAGTPQGSFDSQLYAAASSDQAANIQDGLKTADAKAFGNGNDEIKTNSKVQDIQKALEVKATQSGQDKSRQAALSAKDLAETDSSRKGDDTLNHNTKINDTFGIALAQHNKIDSSDNVDQTLKADTAQQVADAVKQAYDNGRSELRLHLSPEDLGGINIRIISQGGVLTLRITADNQHTGQLLASGMHELTQSLQNLGITMNKAEVAYTGFGGFDSTASQQQNQNFGSQNYHLPKWVPAMQNSSDIIQPAVSEQTDLYVTKTSGLSILV